jgi:hypothetical protein
MKRLLVLLVVILFAAASYAQDNNLIWAMTVNVKMDKKLEWEKKVVAYAKTHLPNAKFRVWEVISGDRTGSYVVIAGPTNYKSWSEPNVSPKGEAMMKADGQALDALCNWTSNMYWTDVDGLGSSNSDRKLNYQVATYYEIKMGSWGEVREILMRMKASRDKAGAKYDYAIMRPSNSGAGNAFISIRWAEKMEELESGPGFGVSDKYDEIYGNNSFYKDINSYFGMLKSSHSEIRVLRRDLSSM